MTIEQLVPLTNGLSLTACNQTLVLDRTRITRLPDRSIEMAFRIAGTSCSWACAGPADRRASLGRCRPCPGRLA